MSLGSRRKPDDPEETHGVTERACTTPPCHTSANGSESSDETCGLRNCSKKKKKKEDISCLIQLEITHIFSYTKPQEYSTAHSANIMNV